MIMSGIGRIGRDAELKYTSSGMAVCNVTMAFNTGYGDRKATTWVDVTIWGNQAEGLAVHLLKGTAIVAYLKDIKLEEFDKRDGTRGAKITGVLVDLEFAGSKQDGHEQAPAPRQATPSRQQRAAPAPQKFEDFEVDIPF